MTKTLIDIDDKQLARARRILGTKTKRDTVNQALAEVIRKDALRRELERMRSGAYADLLDPEVMSGVWR